MVSGTHQAIVKDAINRGVVDVAQECRGNDCCVACECCHINSVWRVQDAAPLTTPGALWTLRHHGTLQQAMHTPSFQRRKQRSVSM